MRKTAVPVPPPEGEPAGTHHPQVDADADAAGHQRPLEGILAKALVMLKMMELIKDTKNQTCTRQNIQDAIKREGFTITPTFCTQQMGEIASTFPFLGLFLEKPKKTRIWQEGVTNWYTKSRCYTRLNDDKEEKERLAKLVGKELEKLTRTQLPVYFDAGSTSLFCARNRKDLIRNWTVLTNNLLLACDLIGPDISHPECYLPAGHADQDTAAIVEASPKEFDAWIQDNQVEVSVVSFHWLTVTDGGALTFYSNEANEQTSKIAAIRYPRVVFIPITHGKMTEPGTNKKPTVQFSGGKWFDLRSTPPVELPLAAQTIFFCTNKSLDDLPELYGNAIRKLAEQDPRVKVLCPLKRDRSMS